METLGLGSAREREDNFFQRLFWPTIHNQYDVDVISRRGFWLAFVVGLLSSAVLVAQRNLVIGLFTLVVFLLGASGIRQRSIAASAMVLALYTIGVVGSWVLAFLGGPPVGNPFISIIFIMLLCSNLRATILSDRWQNTGTDTEFPEETDRGVTGVLVNRAPRAIWPIGRYAFFVLASLYLVLTLAGFVAMRRVHRTVTVEEQTPSAELQGAPR